jgi:hypothetical protein
MEAKTDSSPNSSKHTWDSRYKVQASSPSTSDQYHFWRWEVYDLRALGTPYYWRAGPYRQDIQRSNLRGQQEDLRSPSWSSACCRSRGCSQDGQDSPHLKLNGNCNPSSIESLREKSLWVSAWRVGRRRFFLEVLEAAITWVRGVPRWSQQGWDTRQSPDLLPDQDLQSHHRVSRRERTRLRLKTDHCLCPQLLPQEKTPYSRDVG